MRLILYSLISLAVVFFIFSVHISYANDINFTVNGTNNGSLNILQDGEDNDIDFDVQRMNGFDIDLTQVGDDNTIDVDVDGRTSNGSSMAITQTGDNKSYSGTFYCGHSSCSMTVNQ